MGWKSALKGSSQASLGMKTRARTRRLRTGLGVQPALPCALVPTG